MPKLRARLIRLAAALPKGSQGRGEILRLLRASNTTKAKVGDLIQSLHFRRPADGSIIGTVVRVEKDDRDGVEYVYYRPIVDIGHDGLARKMKHKEMRAPQNGTPTSMGRITEGIYIIT